MEMRPSRRKHDCGEFWQIERWDPEKLARTPMPYTKYRCPCGARTDLYGIFPEDELAPRGL